MSVVTPALQWLMSVQAYQLLVTVVGIAMSAGPLVQGWKIWRARSARDVSLFNFALLGGGCAVWLGWGLRSPNPPLVVSNICAVSSYAFAIIMILLYRRAPRSAEAIKVPA